MVYKRYIRKNGKVYGPYAYHSRKKEGKVVSEYRGKPKKETKINKIWPFIILGLILVFLLIFILSYTTKTTGSTISENQTTKDVAFIKFLDESSESDYTQEHSISSEEVKE